MVDVDEFIREHATLPLRVIVDLNSNVRDEYNIQRLEVVRVKASDPRLLDINVHDYGIGDGQYADYGQLEAEALDVERERQILPPRVANDHTPYPEPSISTGEPPSEDGDTVVVSISRREDDGGREPKTLTVQVTSEEDDGPRK